MNHADLLVYPTEEMEEPLQSPDSDTTSLRILKALFFTSLIYPMISWIIILCCGFSTRYVDFLSGRAFIFGDSFITREFHYVSEQWPSMEAQKGAFVLFEYLLIGFVAIAFVKALFYVFSLRLFDASLGKLFGPDPAGRRRKGLLPKGSFLFTTPILIGVNLFLMTNIQEQMKVDLLRNWIQHSVYEYVAMQMFMLSVSLAFLIDLTTIFIWKISRYEYLPV